MRRREREPPPSAREDECEAPPRDEPTDDDDHMAFETPPRPTMPAAMFGMAQSDSFSFLGPAPPSASASQPCAARARREDGERAKGFVSAFGGATAAFPCAAPAAIVTSYAEPAALDAAFDGLAALVLPQDQQHLARSTSALPLVPLVPLLHALKWPRADDAALLVFALLNDPLLEESATTEPRDRLSADESATPPPAPIAAAAAPPRPLRAEVTREALRHALQSRRCVTVPTLVAAVRQRDVAAAFSSSSGGGGVADAPALRRLCGLAFDLTLCAVHGACPPPPFARLISREHAAAALVSLLAQHSRFVSPMAQFLFERRIAPTAASSSRQNAQQQQQQHAVPAQPHASVSRDQWMMMCEFCRAVEFPTLRGYDAGGAWHSAVDEFVQWFRDHPIPEAMHSPDCSEDTSARFSREF